MSQETKLNTFVFCLSTQLQPCRYQNENLGIFHKKILDSTQNRLFSDFISIWSEALEFSIKKKSFVQFCSKCSAFQHTCSIHYCQMFRISLQMSQLSNMKCTVLLYRQIHWKPSPSQSIHFSFQLSGDFSGLESVVLFFAVQRNHCVSSLTSELS